LGEDKSGVLTVRFERLVTDFADFDFRRSSRAFRSAMSWSNVSCATFGSTLSGRVAEGRISRHFMRRE
jgi:hypothetical protein